MKTYFTPLEKVDGRCMVTKFDGLLPENSAPEFSKYAILAR
jgi:hypothetical protein